jgi:hypothetical protein
MKFYIWFFKVVIVAIICLVFYYLSIIQVISQFFLPYCVIGIACCKVSYILHSTYQKIIESARNNILFHQFLLFVLGNMSLAIFSFACDFWNIYVTEHYHFQGINPNFTIAEEMFECLYFSMLTYSYFGYGEIMPITIPAKMLIMMEIGLAFLTMIFVLADFIGLKESLQEDKS